MAQGANKRIENSTQNGNVQTVYRGGAGGSLLSIALECQLACLFDVKRWYGEANASKRCSMHCANNNSKFSVACT